MKKERVKERKGKLQLSKRLAGGEGTEGGGEGGEKGQEREKLLLQKKTPEVKKEDRGGAGKKKQ